MFRIVVEMPLSNTRLVSLITVGMSPSRVRNRFDWGRDNAAVWPHDDDDHPFLANLTSSERDCRSRSPSCDVQV